MPKLDELRDLAAFEPGAPVLSVLLRTDPRDPANTKGEPAWRVTLRSGLNRIGRDLDAAGDRDLRLAFRELAPRIEAWAGALGPAERGRSIVRFLSTDGALDRTFTLQLPLLREHVVWDASPYILPLVAVADRGRATGLVLVGRERVRLLEWREGRVEEPPDSTYAIESGEWAAYAAYAEGNSARGQQTGRHPEGFEPRNEHHRDVFFQEAADATAGRLRELGWARVLIAGEGDLPARFADHLGADARRLVCGELPRNLLEASPAEVEQHVEPLLLELAARDARALAQQALSRTAAGGHATLGLQATATALVERRVERLLVDPLREFGAEAADDPSVAALLRGAGPDLLAERAVEAAVAAGAQVTSIPGGNGDGALGDAGGIAALLRF